MAFNSSGVPPCLEANPDISGVGVRISFYLQTIALVLLTARSLDESLNSVWTLLGTSFGLTVSALVTAVQKQLPLYQAIIVTDLVWLSNFAIFMALATYNRHPRGSYNVQYAAILQTYIAMCVLFYLWAQAAALESESHVGKTVFVVLFISTPAAGTGRTIALVVTTLMSVGYSVTACLFLYRHPKFWASAKKPHAPKTSHPPSMPLAPLNGGAAPNHRHSATSTGGHLPPRLTIDPHLMTLIICFMIPYVITIICTELQLTRNRLCYGDTFWGFGQILAMTVTIVPVVITIGAFRKYGWKQRPRVVTERTQSEESA
ncbi:hypothetical protein B0H11DRAFT_2135524 [Mycena galericulata]|nr:hypothetical protein B0H11DRAFT_2135524 [Mycena galericulata]